MDVGSISDERLIVVSQYCRGPIPLVPFSHVGNVLMKTFASLITDLSAVIREEIQVGVQKMDLLRTYYSRNREIKPTYPQPDPCSFRPCHSLGSLSTLDRTHPKPVFLHFEEDSQTWGL
ncbi:hypothetical protein AVEN_245460-1 [Araneus ventricosus]|uniref:Uncharacterized protein n=1 Tax=Araneus ventricosus TaxID=182803 RepID=A0A4Y2D7X8_ARAVE|nr:hypothetical protein AVEN_245460-1 [Araneus ventricosus]